MKNKYFSILKYNRFAFGEQIVSQFVLFECKALFSIIFFYFHKTTKAQDRFHTHAFNALSIKLFGQYDEHVLVDENTGQFFPVRRKKILQYFPKKSFHRIANSNGCCTLLFAGPWEETWKEYVDGKILTYKWGRESKK